MKAESNYQKALAIMEQRFGPNHHSIDDYLDQIAYFYYSIGDYEKAASYYERALAIREQVFNPDDYGLSRSHKNFRNLAVVYLSQNDFSKADAVFDRSVEKVAKWSIGKGAILNDWAFLFASKDYFQKAYTIFKQAVEEDREPRDRDAIVHLAAKHLLGVHLGEDALRLEVLGRGKAKMKFGCGSGRDRLVR